MLLSLLILAISVSVDSLGIGITYGIRDTKISFPAKAILFFGSFFIASISLLIGNLFTAFLPKILVKLIGAFLLFFMGCWILYESFQPHVSQTLHPHSSPKTYQIFFRSLGITIQIIRDPISSDLDHSNSIDAREALYLALALSIDSLCVGISSSMIGINSFLFPILVSSFQIFFLSIGDFLGKKLISYNHIPNNVWSILSGILLIGFGFSRLFL